jgi:hypothetical protein
MGFLFVALLPAIFEETADARHCAERHTGKRVQGFPYNRLLYFALIHNQAESIVGHFPWLFACYIVWI